MALEFYLRREFPSIRVITCEYEADLVLGLRCQELNRQKAKSAYILSDDTDFLVMKDSPSIYFQDLLHHSAPSLTDSFRLPVWRRVRIATYLKMDEAQFVDFCILLGNDVTNPDFVPKS